MRTLGLKIWFWLFLPVSLNAFGQSVHADFNYTVDEEVSSLTYLFYDKSTSTEPIIHHFWTFGDGTSSKKQNPEHQYLTEGIYPLSLQVITADSLVSVKKDTVYVQALAPPTCMAYFTFAYLASSPAYTYAFTDHSVTGNNDSIISWSWDFGDGSHSSVQSPIHQYNSTGNYTVKQDIQTKNGCNSSYSFTISVFNGNSPCAASFSFQQDSTNTLGLYFHDNSQHSTSITSWRWYFDDGDSSVLQDPHHVFPYAGLYMVRLKITTSGGCSDEMTLPVQVGNPQPHNLWGRVYAGPYVIDKCIAYLYKEFNNNYFKPIDTVRLTSVNDTLGVYYFFQIPEGKYRVKVLLPDNSVYWQNFAPTYYGNHESWKYGSTLQLFQDISMANVNLKEITASIGHCQLNLSVVTNTNQIERSNIELLLYNSSGDLVGCSFTDALGEASFDDLAPGTYHLTGDITGFEADFLNIAFAQDFDTIYNVQLTVNQSALTGFFKRPPEISPVWKIYPNPASSQINLVPETASGIFEIEISDVSGRVIERLKRQFFKSETILLDISKLNSGLYLLKIRDIETNKISVKKFIKKL